MMSLRVISSAAKLASCSSCTGFDDGAVIAIRDGAVDGAGGGAKSLPPGTPQKRGELGQTLRHSPIYSRTLANSAGHFPGCSGDLRRETLILGCSLRSGVHFPGILPSSDLTHHVDADAIFGSSCMRVKRTASAERDLAGSQVHLASATSSTSCIILIILKIRHLCN